MMLPPTVPDFRSPTTGLYANLARLNLPYAEAVFDISYFRQKPEPFYVLAKELYPGNYAPTISHVFITLLANKGLLSMLFTQNIDCLEREAGVPDELIVEAHGSFATQRCIECKRTFPDDKMKQYVLKGEVPHCLDKQCDGLVKPDIVFFGEQLPASFYNNRSVPAMADLVLILGTSLTVHPFASLPELVRDGVPRVLFNMERVGSLGTKSDDVLVLGDCDSGVRRLADELGWRDELEELWRVTVGEKEAAKQLQSSKQREEKLEDEVSRLADEVESGLKLANGDTDTTPEDSHTEKEFCPATHGSSKASEIISEQSETKASPVVAKELSKSEATYKSQPEDEKNTIQETNGVQTPHTTGKNSELAPEVKTENGEAFNPALLPKLA
ncbi:putative sir2 family protein [Phaeoacremonium minimum UCRPA7]|uniref:Putative sir2 family protein n=1 Tax=Phaeoacremonium minimum (strain UCR-PA7) TaxID=1286976 RepID=R8BQQ0_PHAM7|nr:putative sir2 family protein [Phaeoacremonium minimum UCRPA7]EOO01686.1 putative sir2 family protein [Phaeoacremonium minimum UCRPA7]